MIFDQSEFDLRCEWGQQGVTNIASISDVVVIVDVLSFSTCIDIATSRDAIVFPYRSRDSSIDEYAKSINALLASRDRASGYSLSPTSLLNIPPGTRLVLPSPNGSTLTLSTGKTITLTGCLRNCMAVAQFAQTCGTKIAVIPAGERWDDGSLRPAWEDWIGAGAILSYLSGRLSPEADAAIAAFERVKERLEDRLCQCSSGKELISRGFATDVKLASAFNSSDRIPIFLNDAYVNAK
jgi:2-phosphosulfolactate phosphatase